MEQIVVAGQQVRVLRIAVDECEPLQVLQLAHPESALDAAIRGKRDPYAGILWPSSIALARALLPEIEAGAYVIDAGAGTGLISLAAARRGAHVLALDHDPVALELLAAGAARQSLQLETALFDLTSAQPLPRCDVIIFSDLLYQRDFALMVAGRAVEAVRQGAKVLVGDPGRIGRDAFTAAVAAHGLATDFVPVRVEVPGEEREEWIGIARLLPHPAHRPEPPLRPT
jgi:predicted nicotinamide N-methyase